MVSKVTKDDKGLEGRVDVLEREVDGEKMVTRHILEQTRRNGDDLAAVKLRLDRVEGRLDGVDGRFDGLDKKVDRLREDMPGIVGDTMRAVLRERDSS